MYSVMGVGLVLIEVFQQYVRMVPMMRPTMLPMRTMVTMDRQNISKLLQGTPEGREECVYKIISLQRLLSKSIPKTLSFTYLVRGAV